MTDPTIPDPRDPKATTAAGLSRRAFLTGGTLAAGAGFGALYLWSSAAEPTWANDDPNHQGEDVLLAQFSDSGELLGVSPQPRIVKSEKEWKEYLTPRQYAITREKGTERAFTGKYDKLYKDGIYRCVACGTALFSSETKFDSGTGWPSFHTPIAEENVATEMDLSMGIPRTEVLCRRCGAHLGHVFPDGPPPTHQRYCMNSAALVFVPLK